MEFRISEIIDVRQIVVEHKQIKYIFEFFRIEFYRDSTESIEFVEDYY